MIRQQIQPATGVRFDFSSSPRSGVTPGRTGIAPGKSVALVDGKNICLRISHCARAGPISFRLHRHSDRPTGRPTGWLRALFYVSYLFANRSTPMFGQGTGNGAIVAVRDAKESCPAPGRAVVTDQKLNANRKLGLPTGLLSVEMVLGVGEATCNGQETSFIHRSEGRRKRSKKNPRQINLAWSSIGLVTRLKSEENLEEVRPSRSLAPSKTMENPRNDAFLARIKKPNVSGGVRKRRNKLTGQNGHGKNEKETERVFY